MRHTLNITMTLAFLLAFTAVGVAQTGLGASPTGRVEVKESFRVLTLVLEPPALSLDEYPAYIYLLRSTSNLSRLRSDESYPVARIPLDGNQTVYLDSMAPQDVTLYYQ